MSLAEIDKPPFSRRTTIRVQGDRMTVSHVLAFADALREDGIDGREFVEADRAYSTGHFCGLRAHYETVLTEEKK